MKLARDEFDTGIGRISSFRAADLIMSFVAVRGSGYGGEHGAFGLEDLVNI